MASEAEELVRKTLVDTPFLRIHSTPVLEAIQMKQSVDKQSREVFCERSSEPVILLAGARHVHKNIAGGPIHRKCEYVRRLVYVAIRAVQAPREDIADEYQRKVIARSDDKTRRACRIKTHMRRRGAKRRANGQHAIFLKRLVPRFCRVCRVFAAPHVFEGA